LSIEEHSLRSWWETLKVRLCNAGAERLARHAAPLQGGGTGGSHRGGTPVSWLRL